MRLPFRDDSHYRDNTTIIMHSEKDPELAVQQLEKLRINGEAYHKTKADILERYAALMEDLKGPKSDYEGERDPRE